VVSSQPLLDPQEQGSQQRLELQSLGDDEFNGIVFIMIISTSPTPIFQWVGVSLTLAQREYRAISIYEIKGYESNHAYKNATSAHFQLHFSGIYPTNCSEEKPWDIAHCISKGAINN
jgi:hypothetical protein